MRKLELRNKRLKLNTDLRGHKAGSVIVIKYQGDVPVEKYWRDRVSDSATDNCVEVLTNRPKAVTSDKIAKKSNDEPQTKGKV